MRWIEKSNQKCTGSVRIKRKEENEVTKERRKKKKRKSYKSNRKSWQRKRIIFEIKSPTIKSTTMELLMRFVFVFMGSLFKSVIFFLLGSFSLYFSFKNVCFAFYLSDLFCFCFSLLVYYCIYINFIFACCCCYSCLKCCWFSRWMSVQYYSNQLSTYILYLNP